jgi:hypothetical protein
MNVQRSCPPRLTLEVDSFQKKRGRVVINLNSNQKGLRGFVLDHSKEGCGCEQVGPFGAIKSTSSSSSMKTLPPPSAAVCSGSAKPELLVEDNT